MKLDKEDKEWLFWIMVIGIIFLGVLIFISWADSNAAY